jgi:hypothetical protein
MATEWNLTDERKAQYSQAIQAAQEAETNIGSLTYKLYKFNKMREEIDETLKGWWDMVLKEMNLEKNRNYMITKDGVIKDVTPEAPKTDTVQPVEISDVQVVETVQPQTVADLK